MGRAAYVVRIAALLLFCAALAAACGGDSGPTPSPTQTPTPTPAPSATLAPTPTPAPPPASSEPPERDLIDLARRFNGLPAEAPRTARQSPFDHQLGDREQFTILDINAPSLRTVTASVRLITDRAYFFVQDGVSVGEGTLARIGRDFDGLVYPRVTGAFGKEWSPGVDGDPRISIVHADLSGAGGYVTSSDEFPRQVVARSNEREAIYLDSSFLAASAGDYNAVLAHELQHMVHWNADSGEDSWVNEGLSQVSAELAGGGAAATDSFLAAPDTQLNDWPTGGPGVHYGESQLFFRYLLDRFGGRENAVALLAEPGDGITGVEAYLQRFDITFREVFADWVIANYLDEDSGPYAHKEISAGITAAESIQGPGEGEGTVHQFAADYLEVNATEGGVFAFDGSDEVGIGIEPRDGPFWWSNRGDDIDSRLTREFDLTGLDSATLRFQTWFETEQGWDYAYVAASRDGGETWEALPGPHTTDLNPVGQAYGPGFSGDSGGWIQEEVDLSAYAGGKLLLRFEYITDDSASARGFAVDDISIPELDFVDDADSDGGWLTEGFRRVEAPEPQAFVVQLIDRDSSEVARLELSEGNRVEVTLDGPATIVVAAVTEGTTETATYTWSLRR